MLSEPATLLRQVEPPPTLVGLVFCQSISSPLVWTKTRNLSSILEGIKIPVPSLDIQQQLVTEVEQLEAEITSAQVVIDNATARKNAILTKYL